MTSTTSYQQGTRAGAVIVLSPAKVTIRTEPGMQACPVVQVGTKRR